MKTAQENFPERLLSQKRHPVCQKLLSVLLCACLLLASLPMEGYGSEVQAEGPQKKILSLSELPEEVKYQTVEPGTPLEELNLPETLEGVCILVGQDSNVNPETPDVKGTASEGESLLEEMQEVSQHTEETEAPKETQEVSGDGNSEVEFPAENEAEEPESPAENGSEEQPESPTPDSEPGTEEVPETNPDSNVEETVVIEHVTWTGTPAYDSETEGVYVFAPVLPEGYVLAEGVGLPEIQVMVKSEKTSEGEGAGQETFSEGKKEESGAGEELTEEYVSGAEEREYGARAASIIREISEGGETWDGPVTLSDMELVINEGVILTIEDTVNIDGTVIIQGGGTIIHGDHARIEVNKGADLTMENITIDGQEVRAYYSKIRAMGSLTMNNCKIQNCRMSTMMSSLITYSASAVTLENNATGKFNGCIIENCAGKVDQDKPWGIIVRIRDGSTAVFNDCIIENCRNTLFSCEDSTLTMENNCIIRNCEKSGGVFTLTVATGNFSDCTIENCGKVLTAGGYNNKGSTVVLNGCTIENSGGISVAGDGVLTLENGCKIKNCVANNGLRWGVISIDYATGNFSDSTFENCTGNPSKSEEIVGGAVYLNHSTGNFNNCIIENCSANVGGAIACRGSTLRINGGSYRNNKALMGKNNTYYDGNGGFLCCRDTSSNSYPETYYKSSFVRINGGNFIGNSAENGGGAIFAGTAKIYISDSDFQGNICNQAKYPGSGAVMFSSDNTQYSKDGYLLISGDIRFSGDGTNSGMDGIYLDSQNSLPRKMGVGKRLGGMVTVYLEAVEHYVVAEGTSSYSLTEEDQENISVVDVNGRKWYKKLDTEANQIYLTKEETVCKTLSADFYSGGPDPSEPHHEKQEVEEDVESVTIAAPALKNFPDWTPMGWTENAKGDEAYQSTVAEGGDCTLTEEGKKYYGVYQKEVTLTYDSADKAVTADVTMPGEGKETCYANVHKDEITYKEADFTLPSGPEVSDYIFQGWSEQESGGGTLHEAGSSFSIQENTTLYAVYEEKGKRTFTADFYSGDPLQIKSESDIRDEDATEGTVTVPSPENITDWTFLGWNKNKGAYTADTDIRSGHTLTLTEDKTEYYGIYETEITLTYNANGGDSTPPEDTQKRYANVHETTGYQDPDFTIAPAIHREGHTFVEWNTKADGSGDRYTAGSRESFTKDTTLYAVFVPKGQKQLAADFYSGGPNQKETIVNTVEDTVSGADITVPELKEMAGWTALGWNKSKGAYTADDDIRPGRSLTLTEPLTEYYGIYEKDITLSYDSNGGGEAPAPEKKACYASVHQKITQKYPDFTIAGAIHREGHIFVGWNTEADGTGTSYEPGSTRKLEEDTLLYAVWKETSTAPEPSEPSGPTEPEPSGPDAPAPETAPYRVEYYCQNLTGEEYTRMDSDTETLTGTVGTEAEASRKTYTGFTLNLSHPSGKPKGTVERDGSLVLKLYYDRLIYEVDFSLNGGQGKAPDTQHIRYGGLLEQVGDPLRRGYNFKGWYMDDKGMDGGIWDFGSPVEHNTGTLKTTLYAKWADELAPAMGKASFSRGSRDFLDWLIQKESMVVTVPVTEEGSGLEKAEYLLVAEDGTEQDGQAAFTELHTMTDTMAAYGSSAAVLRSIRGEAESGSYEARIAIEEEFKGKVYLTCTDYAGNVSPQKILTAEGGGVIVEDNAPEIRFDGTKETTGGNPLEVKVEVRDSEEDRVTSGISGVRYQVDKKKSVSLPEEDFTGDFAEVCEFTVKIKGEGKHTLRVEAEDHAGNESAAEVTLNISGSREVPKEVPADQNPGNPGGSGRTGKPLGGEPQTGDSTQIQICATLSMIAGFGYLLLYFEGENGITEQEKEEMIHRIVTWAKQGGRIRRLLGLAGIFLFLAYYHSIGKSVDVEWKEVYGKI